MTVKNINDLREHAAKTLELLDQGKIDTTRAAINAKLYESMVSSLKTELEYHRMLKQCPTIKFLDCAKFRPEDDLGISNMKTKRLEKR